MKGSVLRKAASRGVGQLRIHPWKLSVDFVRRDLDEAGYTSGLSGIEKHPCPYDIRLNEGGRSQNGAIHMALRSQVQDGIHPLQELLDQRAIAYVPVHEGVPGVALHLHQIGKVPGVGEEIQVDDLHIRPLLEEEANQVGADKSGPPGDQKLQSSQLSLNSRRSSSVAARKFGNFGLA